MHMIMTHDSTKNLYLQLLTYLTNKIAHTNSKITLENLIPIFRYPYEMILNFVFGMTAATILHAVDVNPTPS